MTWKERKIGSSYREVRVIGSRLYYILSRIKEARGSFFGRGVEVLKLQSRIEDQLRSPSYYIMIST